MLIKICVQNYNIKDRFVSKKESKLFVSILCFFLNNVYNNKSHQQFLHSVLIIVLLPTMYSIIIDEYILFSNNKIPLCVFMLMYLYKSHDNSEGR